MFSSQDNRRRFWYFVRCRKRSPPPPVFNHNDVQFTQSNAISAEFKYYFSSVFNPQGVVPDNPPHRSLPIP